MAVQPKHRQLPDKETKLFKELLTQYELKQYKKGIKAADTILKKFPNHGETIALKALTMSSALPYPATVSSIAKLPEIEEMARIAVKKDMSSHITWHVLGIMAKNRKDYKDASQAFSQARKIDPDNLPLLRDSMSLYLHTRQYASAVQVRQHFLTLRPQIRSSWVGLMVAHHLNGDIPSAIETYEALQSCINVDGGTAPERAQTALYVIRLCIEQGDYENALKRLDTGLSKKVINARGEISHMRADILLKLDRKDEAKDAFAALLKQNPDNLMYYQGLLRADGLDISSSLSEEQRAEVLKKLDGLREEYPKSTAPRRLSLSVAQGERFRELTRAYLIASLEKGIPSLFVDVKGLYRDASKLKIVGEIMEDLITSLENEKLHDDDSIPPPTTLLWAYYFLALHIAHPLNPSSDYERALSLLSKALDHTPTLPEILMAKAKVLKRAGDPQGAAHAMEEARLLDLQDRFLNGKAAKYWLRAGDVAKAEELLAMFTKKDMTAPVDLTEMQCLWFLQEEGDSHKRNGNLGMALKRYQALATTFRDYEDDHYDFHQYCLRRMTLSAYIDLMRYEDQLYSHAAYFKAALAAIDIYTRISDKPELTEEKLSEEDEAERKKAAKKAQKAEQKAKKAAAAASDGKKDDPPAPDDDPEGTKLLKTETPLDDAFKLWTPLQKLAASRIETWTTGYEIYIRKSMYLAALKCLNEAAAINRSSPVLHRQIIHFSRIITTAKIPDAVKSAIEKAFDLIPSSTTPADLNRSFISSAPTSAAHILAGAQSAIELSTAASAEDVESILSKIVQADVPASVEQLTLAIEVLKQAGAEDEQVKEFRSKCRRRLPLAWVFASDEERASRKLKQGADGVAVNGEKTDV